MESCDEAYQSVNCSFTRWTSLSKYNKDHDGDDAANGVADVDSDDDGLIGGMTTIMMMMNEKRTPLKPRIHDQILKQVGEAAHPHRDKRGPDLENNTS